MRTASGVTYLHGDHLGSTNVTSGASTSTQTYYPYGTVRSTSGTLPTDYTFTGQKLDASSGLMYYGARYYDAAIGRFAQPDSIVPNPFNPQDLNRYSYARNNPVRYRDPSGHWLETAWDIANVVWDIHEFGNDPSWVNGAALVVDVAAVILPAVPAGAGLVARVGKGGQAAAKIASHAGDLTDAAKAVSRTEKAVDAGLAAGQKLVKVGRAAPEAADLIKTIARQSARNVDATHILLGSYPEYKDLARLEGMGYFDMSPEVADLLKNNPDLAWSVNKQYMDDAIAAGKKIAITLGEDRKIGEGLAEELKYLDELVDTGILEYVDGIYIPL